MKKYILAGVIIVLGIIVGASYVKAYPSALVSYNSQTATSSVGGYFLGTGTSVTFNLYGGKEMNQVDENELFVIENASTSASKLQWKYEFSGNGTDWYGEDANSGSAIIDHSTTTVVHQWTPGTTSTTSLKALVLPSVRADFKRVTFTAVGATSSIFVRDASRFLPAQ